MKIRMKERSGKHPAGCGVITANANMLTGYMMVYRATVHEEWRTSEVDISLSLNGLNVRRDSGIRSILNTSEFLHRRKLQSRPTTTEPSVRWQEVTGNQQPHHFQAALEADRERLTQDKDDTSRHGAETFLKDEGSPGDQRRRRDARGHTAAPPAAGGAKTPRSDNPEKDESKWIPGDGSTLPKFLLLRKQRRDLWKLMELIGADKRETSRYEK